MGRLTVPEEIETVGINGTCNKNVKHRVQLVWLNIFLFFLLHITTPYGIYLAFTSAKLYTTIFAYMLIPSSLLGITAGYHRLWSHRSYEANRSFQFLLLTMATMTWQGSVIKWSRDHRLHHKYSETDADPHDANRGFFFSHIGWLMCRKHPNVIAKGQGINIDDLLENPLLKFQHKYYYPLAILMCYVIPLSIPMFFWNETLVNAFFLPGVARLVITLHLTFLVNSVAHIWGNRPYDKAINPTDNKYLGIVAAGEGWHNFHHTFPWDYKASEIGDWVGIWRLNLTCCFIDFFAHYGWAWNLKTTPADMVRNVVEKTGDGTHNVWGWNDEDLTTKDISNITVKHMKE